MNKTTSSGNILLKKTDDKCIVVKVDGVSNDPLIEANTDCFSDLQFIAKFLDYTVSKLGINGTFGNDNASLKRLSDSKYEISTSTNKSVILTDSEMDDLMKCIEVSSKWDNDVIAPMYGLKADNRPTVRTIREGKPFPGHSPNITGKHFGISVENNAEVRIYLLDDAGDWVDVFTLYDVNDIVQIKQSFCMVKDAMDWSQPVYISSHSGVFDYEPEYDDRFVKVSIGGELHLLGEEDVSDLIRVFDRMG